MTEGRTYSVVGVVGSPEAGARTSTAVAGVLAGAAKAGCRTSLAEISEQPIDEVVAQIDRADAVVFGSPVYRATYSAMLKQLLETTQRGRHGETTAPLRGKAAAIVMTGASEHHFLSVDGLRAVLATFFAVQVLSPSLYLDHAGFIDRNTLTDEMTTLTTAHGTALADLTEAVRGSARLSAMEPLV